MYVILPNKKDGLQDLVQNFNSTPELLGDCFEVEEENLSKMWIPKFKFSYGFDASRIMQNIGLTLPFEMVGDFTGMIDSLESDKVFLSTILHQSFIEVNEEVTEATALTLAPLYVVFHHINLHLQVLWQTIRSYSRLEKRYPGSCSLLELYLTRL